LKKKNIIVLDIDALIPSRTGIGGNFPFVSPCFDSLSKNGLEFTNAFTMGNPTEFALPGIFASSYLLDDGGYRNGIADREITFAEKLKSAGYVTSAFFTIFRPQKDLYHRGFDDFYHLYDLQVIEKNFMNTANWYIGALDKGTIKETECKKELFAYYKEYLEDVFSYCNIWIDYIENETLPKSKIFHNINYQKVKERVVKHLELVVEDPEKAVKPILAGEKIEFTKIVEEEGYKRKKKLKNTLLDFKFRAQIVKHCLRIFRQATSFDSAKNTFALALDRILHGQSNLLMRYPSGSYVLESFKGWHRKQKKEKPFYSYIKLLDAHEFNFYSHDLYNHEQEKEDEYKSFKQCLKNFSREKNYKGNILYDCSIKYVDQVLNRLTDYLKKENILHETILAITADHGGTYPNIPARDSKAHRVNAFYDELYRIPLVFSCDGVGSERNQSLVSSVDMVPTLLDMVGEAVPKSFRGNSLCTGGGRPYVMAENQGRGPCDLIRKPIRVCVRSAKYKIVYEVPPGKLSEGVVDQLYDLVDDPEEMLNLKSDKNALGEADSLLQVAKARVVEILN